MVGMTTKLIVLYLPCCYGTKPEQLPFTAWRNISKVRDCGCFPQCSHTCDVLYPVRQVTAISWVFSKIEVWLGNCMHDCLGGERHRNALGKWRSWGVLNIVCSCSRCLYIAKLHCKQLPMTYTQYRVPKRYLCPLSITMLEITSWDECVALQLEIALWMKPLTTQHSLRTCCTFVIYF